MGGGLFGISSNPSANRVRLISTTLVTKVGTVFATYDQTPPPARYLRQRKEHKFLACMAEMCQ